MFRVCNSPSIPKIFMQLPLTSPLAWPTKIFHVKKQVRRLKKEKAEDLFSCLSSYFAQLAFHIYNKLSWRICQWTINWRVRNVFAARSTAISGSRGAHLTNVELPWGNKLVSTGLQFVVGLVQRVPRATAMLFAVSIFSVRYTSLVASARG
jgi:hypothetical protein